MERLRVEGPARAEHMRPVLHYAGLPIDAQSVTDGVLAHERARSTEGVQR